MDNRMSCWDAICPNGDQSCKFTTFTNNIYIVKFERDKKYIDISFKHKTIEGITNLFETLEVFGLVSNIIKNYMEEKPEEIYYRIKNNNKIVLKIIKLIYKNHGYIDIFDMIENNNEICFEKKNKNVEYNIFKILEGIMMREYKMTDKDLSDEIKNIVNKSRLEWYSYRLNKILKKRVKEYCKDNKIKIKDYNGELPFRAFEINVETEKYKKRYDHIKKREDLFFNNLQKLL